MSRSPLRVQQVRVEILSRRSNAIEQSCLVIKYVGTRDPVTLAVCSIRSSVTHRVAIKIPEEFNERKNALDSSPIVEHLRKLVIRHKFIGTASQLLLRLQNIAKDRA